MQRLPWLHASGNNMKVTERLCRKQECRKLGLDAQGLKTNLDPELKLTNRLQ
jgi:hypothetical protein